jgi:serine/threonine-protein kinase HipA
MNATLQIFHGGRWHTAAIFTPGKNTLRRGIAGGGTLEYIIDYAVARAEDGQAARVSLRYPVAFDLHRSDRWPPFLLDLMPSGAGRRAWLRRLGLRDGESADWPLLIQGAGNPPGKVRVAEAVIPPAGQHPGFTREEIVEKNADFIEYAEARGAVVAGATDVQGDAPKFLLARDRHRRWHPDGALEDRDVLDCWLVKFARGKSAADLAVLRNEAPYLEVARRFGLRVGAPLQFIDNSLFIPRFDRSAGPGGLERHGFETLASAAGIAEFGKRAEHGLFCAAIARFAADAPAETMEYLRRDILNAALRNTDNHGRNSAFLQVAPSVPPHLSPLYDFAPMFLDPEGIPRSSRWAGDLEPVAGRPVWGRVAESLATIIDARELRSMLAKEATTVARLPETMRDCGVEEEVIDKVARRCAEIAEDLRDAAPKG